MADETRVSHGIHGKDALRRNGTARPIDDRIGKLAEAQHGVVARRQLLELGMGLGAIEHRISVGRLRRVQRGVYAVGHRPETQLSRWMAAVLSAGPEAVLSHRSAGSLWGILPPMAISPEVTRPTRGESRSTLRIHRSQLRPDEIRCVEGIPVTSAPRVMLDIAELSTMSQLEKALNEMEVRGITDELSILDLLKRHPRKRGNAKLRKLLADDEAVRGVTREELERRFAAQLTRTDLPRPRFNADLAVDGRIFNVDCLWSAHGLVLELDSRTVHGTQRAFEQDREKDRMLQAAGWRVIRVTWRQLRDDAPAVVEDLRRVLANGGALTL